MKKTIGKMAGIYLALILLFTAALWLVSAIPNSRMQRAVDSFQDRWEQEYVEGGYPEPFFGNSQATIDLYTDGAMYERLTTEDGMGALQSAMYAKDYTRYWHGYLIVLKPLSLFLTYPQIRYLNMFIINILCFLSGMMLYRKTKRTGAACALILGLTATFLIVAPISFQYMASYTVMFLTVLALLGNLEKRKLGMPELFFGCGMCISFFDFLTFPVITLGIPLIVWLLADETGRSFRNRVKALIGYSVSWAAGYVLCWSTKWILGSLILGRNILTDALNQVLFRSVGSAEEVTTPGEALSRNVGMLNYMNWPAVCLVIPGILLAVLGWRQWKADRDTALRYLLILGVCLYPYLWYIAFSNHSQIHYFFTYRAQAVTVFGVLAVLLGLLGDWYQSRRKSL